MPGSRGVYTVSFFEQSLTTANGDYDLWEIDAAADKPVEIIAIFIGNKSEVGDAQEEMVSWSVTRFSGGTFTSGNGTATTPVALDPSDSAASFAAETVGATVATTTGTTFQVHQDTFNIRTGLQFIFPPDMRPKLDGTAQSALVIRLRTALVDDATISGTLYVREL
jgi:hypothetical protein